MNDRNIEHLHAELDKVLDLVAAGKITLEDYCKLSMTLAKRDERMASLDSSSQNSLVSSTDDRRHQ